MTVASASPLALCLLLILIPSEAHKFPKLYDFLLGNNVLESLTVHNFYE